MPLYIRFENNKQVETGIHEVKPEGEGWYELPENLDQNKSYKLTEEGEIVERTEEDIEEESLQNAKTNSFEELNNYFNRYTADYIAKSLQKIKLYEIYSKAVENILAVEKDIQIIEPLAKAREISIIEMAKLILNREQKAVKIIAKCAELEELAKKRIPKTKTQEELKNLLEHYSQEMQKASTN